MKITEIKTRAIHLPYAGTYYCAYGTLIGADLILVEVTSDEGIKGYGECLANPSAEAILAVHSKASEIMIGRDPLDNAPLMQEVYHSLFVAQGNCSAPRFAAMALSGLEMALWDLAGRALNQPVYKLLGGAWREEISYFGFPQGQSPEEIATGAKDFADAGFEVIYVKIGQSEEIDLEIVRQVRAAIGNRRLRLDPNEAWDRLTAQKMLNLLAPFNVEFVEQPTPAGSLSALAAMRAKSPIALAADQAVFTPDDVFNLCRMDGADLIVLGLHETAGITNFRKAAAIAEAAGIRLCLHGLTESGITTLASLHAAASIPNLDDGNQYMNHFLESDIIAGPDISLKAGKLSLPDRPGLGFEIDWDAIARGEETYKRVRG